MIYAFLRLIQLAEKNVNIIISKLYLHKNNSIYLGWQRRQILFKISKEALDVSVQKEYILCQERVHFKMDYFHA